MDRLREGQTRRVLCTFNWYHDAQTILRNRKKLPKNVFVSEYMPEEWADHRKILKPIYNAAKKREELKLKTRMTRDRLIIDGHTYTVAPVNNVNEVNALLDLPSTCQRFDDKLGTLLFLGSHSPYSNLYSCHFVIDNINYNSIEQYLQSEKAKLFDDDQSCSKIMAERNTYKIKKLGSRIWGFSIQRWKQESRKLAYRAVLAKFAQNKTLQEVLLSNDHQIAESSEDPFWGTGIHLHDRLALDKRSWKTADGGAMSHILTRIRQELHQN